MQAEETSQIAHIGALLDKELRKELAHVMHRMPYSGLNCELTDSQISVGKLSRRRSLSAEVGRQWSRQNSPLRPVMWNLSTTNVMLPKRCAIFVVRYSARHSVGIATRQ